MCQSKNSRYGVGGLEWLTPLLNSNPRGDSHVSDTSLKEQARCVSVSWYNNKKQWQEEQPMCGLLNLLAIQNKPGTAFCQKGQKRVSGDDYGTLKWQNCVCSVQNEFKMNQQDYLGPSTVFPQKPKTFYRSQVIFWAPWWWLLYGSQQSVVNSN